MLRSGGHSCRKGRFHRAVARWFSSPDGWFSSCSSRDKPNSRHKMQIPLKFLHLAFVIMWKEMPVLALLAARCCHSHASPSPRVPAGSGLLGWRAFVYKGRRLRFHSSYPEQMRITWYLFKSIAKCICLYKFYIKIIFNIQIKHKYINKHIQFIHLY